jgi:hypothetical protein
MLANREEGSVVEADLAVRGVVPEVEDSVGVVLVAEVLAGGALTSIARMDLYIMESEIRL